MYFKLSINSHSNFDFQHFFPEPQTQMSFHDKKSFCDTFLGFKNVHVEFTEKEQKNFLYKIKIKNVTNSDLTI